MPAPSHRPATFKANRVFTDRDEARALFAQQFTTQQQPNDYRVLNFSGIGGQGKSALCGQFEQYLQATPVNEDQQHAWAKLDFEDGNKRHSIAALLALRLQLAETGKLWFPAFDTAFARYFAITQAGRNLETSYPELFQQPHDLLQGAADIAEALSGLPLLGKLLERLHKFDEQRILQQWLERRGNDLLQGLEALPQYQLEEKLVEYFGADVDDWLHNTLNAPQRRVTLLYDTYEALWRDRPNKTDLLVDKWVRQLVAETPGVLHVMLGREALAWANHEPAEWDGIIIPCPLDNLTDTDADSFLQAVPIMEDDIRARIVESAKGVPFYLSLQVDQYEGDKRRNLAPDIQRYGGKEPEMLARFVSHLPDAMRHALRVAAYPRWLDETVFRDLCGQFLGGTASASFADLTAYSFWTEQDGRYYLHAVMRDYLQNADQQQESVLYRQIHQHLFAAYDSQLQTLASARDITAEHTEALAEGAYHLERLDRAKIPYWVGKYREFFHLAGQWNVLKPLLELSIAITQDIGDKQGMGATLNNISQIYDARGDYNTALEYLQQSLAIQQDIGDVAGLCYTLFNIGHIHLQNEEIAEAVQAWVTVYGIAKQVNLAEILNALESLAGNIGLEGGLQGWEMLAQQMAEA